MKLAILFAALVSSVLGQAFQQDCYRTTKAYGDTVNTTANGSASVYQYSSDLLAIQQLENPTSYVVAAVITCTKDGLIIGQRVGLSNVTNSTSSAIHQRNETTMLNTYGAASRYADECSEYYF